MELFLSCVPLLLFLSMHHNMNSKNIANEGAEKREEKKLKNARLDIVKGEKKITKNVVGG